jgi:O-antigen ligase
MNRTDAYGLVGHFISASPWLGRGFGTFIPQQFFFLDNQYLGTIVETGYLGLVALLGFFLLSWGAARRVRRCSIGASQRDLAQALAAAVAVVAIGFTMFDGLGFPTIDGVIFVVVGCIGALWRLSADERPVRSPASGLARLEVSTP